MFSSTDSSATVLFEDFTGVTITDGAGGGDDNLEFTLLLAPTSSEALLFKDSNCLVMLEISSLILTVALAVSSGSSSSTSFNKLFP